MKTKIRQLKKVNTYDDLENLGIGKVYCDIGYRGGGIGFYADDVANWLNIAVEYLPSKFGAGCNYLGGGVRGSIFASNFSNEITGENRKLLTELGNACVRVYENCENESELNEEEYSDGNTNWETKATKSARKSGIISAY